MTATNHGLMGAVIAITLQKYPVLAIAVAPFTHFLLDAIPHYGGKVDLKSRRFYLTLAIDICIAVTTTLAIATIWGSIWWLVILCGFLAASPDLAWLYYYYLRPHAKKGFISRFHAKIQWSETPQGIVTEILWLVILFPSLLLIGLNQ